MRSHRTGPEGDVHYRYRSRLRLPDSATNGFTISDIPTLSTSSCSQAGVQGPHLSTSGSRLGLQERIIAAGIFGALCKALRGVPLISIIGSDHFAKRMDPYDPEYTGTNCGQEFKALKIFESLTGASPPMPTFDSTGGKNPGLRGGLRSPTGPWLLRLPASEPEVIDIHLS